MGGFQEQLKENLMSSSSVISRCLSLMTSLGDDISGSGSGMCVGSQCPRSRPGLYAYPPDNNRVTGASVCQTRLSSLLFLLPLVVLLLLRWWTTTPLPPVRLWSLEQGWTTRRTKMGCVVVLEQNFAKKWKRHFGKWMKLFFCQQDEQKTKQKQWQYSLFHFAQF